MRLQQNGSLTLEFKSHADRGSKTVYAKLCIWKRTDQDAYNVSIPGSPRVITYVSNEKTSTRYAPHVYKFFKKLVKQAEKEADWLT